jgi:2-keto-4-pentenoate hydratase/2-oxohepta-3-ene-1,7-dioic acid hydratase in catechol pathway
MPFTAQFVDGTYYESAITKVVCVGRNYAEHAKELNNPIPSEPILFIKPESSVIDLSSPFSIPDTDCHYEAEIAVLIGQELSSATQDEVKEGVVALGLALDLTRRELQSKLKEKSHPWEVAKSFDGACPLSKFVPITDCAPLDQLAFTLSINGENKQNGQSSDMLNPIVPLIAHMSTFFTLRPGDVVLTGTPKGVGQLKKGDKLSLTLGNELKVDTETL